MIADTGMHYLTLQCERSASSSALEGAVHPQLVFWRVIHPGSPKCVDAEVMQSESILRTPAEDPNRMRERTRRISCGDNLITGGKIRMSEPSATVITDNSVRLSLAEYVAEDVDWQ